jgi:hypothetical protein
VGVAAEIEGEFAAVAGAGSMSETQDEFGGRNTRASGVPGAAAALATKEVREKPEPESTPGAADIEPETERRPRGGGGGGGAAAWKERARSRTLRAPVTEPEAGRVGSSGSPLVFVCEDIKTKMVTLEDVKTTEKQAGSTRLAEAAPGLRRF